MSYMTENIACDYGYKSALILCTNIRYIICKMNCIFLHQILPVISWLLHCKKQYDLKQNPISTFAQNI